MKTPEFTGPCVLIVDDSADTLSMLNDTLEQAGMNCLLALDAKQALSIAGRMLPDIILVDAIMPNTTGFDLCQQLKHERELHDIPVIFMTGLNDAESLVKAFSVGAALYSCISTRRLVVILCCEFFSIGYNLAIALGYYFTDKDLSALYEPVMVFLVGVEIIAVLPGRTRRDSRSNRGGGNRYRRRSFISSRFFADHEMQAAACKI